MICFRGCLVCGINDEQIQHHLLAKSKLNLKRALETAQSLETAAQNVQALQGTSQQTLSSPELLLMMLVKLQVLTCVFSVERAAIHQ